MPSPESAVPSRDAFDLLALARRKAELGLSTSVVVPAREEEATIGAVIAALDAATVPLDGAPVPLIDELLVVDGASTDRTAARARAAGARVVVQHAGSGPDDGPGKGAALRRGVAETSGDLVAFVDADVVAPDVWLAIGTLAPLILDPSLRLVKSAAQRAWAGGPEPGGGRVTELTVRPLLALHWPAVAHVAQPLAGEYAADRALLESLPFERGYGVELGLLLDTLRHCGAEAIGQVDLGLRGHVHQSLEALGRMAAELVLVMTDRLAREGRAPEGDATGAVLLPRVGRDEDGALHVRTTEVQRAALPPLVSCDRIPARRGPSRRH